MHLQHPLVILILVLTPQPQAHLERIHGGHEATPHSRPYMVLLRKTEEHAKKFCGGFLVNEDYVMTAAHCKGQSYTVILGLHNYYVEKDVQELDVEESIPHPNYNREGYQNDIMLLKLSSKAIFNDKVQSIALADEGDDSLPQSCSVSGWGSTSKNSRHLSILLMEANVTLVNPDVCLNSHSLCSMDDEGPAEGDSGGPLVCERGAAYGVMSSGWQPDAGGPMIHHYAKISDYRSWIDSVLNREEYPTKGSSVRAALTKKKSI